LAFTDFVSVYHSFSSLQCVNVCLHDTLKVLGLCLFVPQLNRYSALLSLTLLNIKHGTDACRVRICIWLFGFHFHFECNSGVACIFLYSSALCA
jgi:hypothetical protein